MDGKSHANTMGTDKNIIDFEQYLSDEPQNVALVQLNTPFQKEDIPLFKRIWKNALLTAAVDGAVNRLYNTPYWDRDEFIPHLVTGDFDSARPEILQFYKDKGSCVIPTPDQDETDFTKCLNIVKEKIQTRNLDVTNIVVFMSMQTNRFDHLMAEIDTLYKARSAPPHLPILLLSRSNIVCLLDVGSHVLRFPPRLQGSKCGLIPVGKPCNRVTTTGLRWNISERRLAFGELISACNELNSPDGTVTVTTDEPIVWTITFSESDG